MGHRTLTRHIEAAGTHEIDFAYDALGRLVSVDDGASPATVYGYDASGRRISEMQGVVLTSYAYDLRGRLIDLHSTRAGATVQRYRYTLDPTGRRSRIEDTGADGTVRVVDYAYDATGRLLGETETVAGAITHSASFGYDRVGNRTTVTSNGTTQTAVFDANDRLLSQGDEHLDYDANGNQVRSTGPTGVVEYVYDARGRLVTAADSATGMAVAFDYDPDGNRIARRERAHATAPETTTRFVVDRSYDLPEVIAELDSSGTAVARYLHAYDLVQQTVNVGTNTETRYILRDGLGSARYLADTAGAITDAFRFEAWGVEREREGESPATHRFAGEYWEEGLGLSFNRARWYAPGQGRFTQFDSFRGVATMPGTLHRYAYVANDPANQVDPSGLSPLLQQSMGMNLHLATLRLTAVQTVRVNTARVAANDALWSTAAGTASAIRAAGVGILTSLALKASSRGRDEFLGVPLIVFGSEFGEHAQHIRDAQTGNGSSFLPAPFALNRTPSWPRGWYNADPVVECNKRARAKFQETRACDEYPFATTRQGGPVNYVLDRVSLRLLDLGESDRTKNFIGGFYTGAQISPDGFSKRSRFIALGIPGIRSFYVDRSGNVRYLAR